MFIAESLLGREGTMVTKRSSDLGGGLGEALIWEPNHLRPHAVLICSHGIQSYSRWFEPLGQRLASRGITVWAFNRPGSGIAREQQHPLDVDSWNEWIDQVRRVARAAQLPGIPTYIVGTSWGARPALAAVAGDQHDFAGAILLNPALKTRRDFAFFVRSWFGLAYYLVPRGSMGIPLRDCDYTTRTATITLWLRDPRMSARITYAYFGETMAMRRTVDQALSSIHRPVLALFGNDDRLVVTGAVEGRLLRIPDGMCTIEHVPHATHCAQIEDEVKDVSERIVRWLSREQTPSSG
jgi:alpha-beta hydrolase superfamily lysophospholipase